MSEILCWTTEKRTLGQLKPYDKNPRVLSATAEKRLKSSLKKSGYVEIIVVDADNTIIAGHQRYYLLFAIHGENFELDVRVPSRKLTETEFKNYLISSNKDRGDWDFDALAADFEINELLDFGFTETELGLNIPNKQKQYKLVLDNTDENREFLDSHNIAYKQRSL